MLAQYGVGPLQPAVQIADRSFSTYDLLRMRHVLQMGLLAWLGTLSTRQLAGKQACQSVGSLERRKPFIPPEGPSIVV